MSTLHDLEPPKCHVVQPSARVHIEMDSKIHASQLWRSGEVFWYRAIIHCLYPLYSVQKLPMTICPHNANAYSTPRISNPFSEHRPSLPLLFFSSCFTIHEATPFEREACIIEPFTRCSGRPALIVSYCFSRNGEEEVGMAYLVVWQSPCLIIKSSRHLGKAFRLDQVIEGERWEHSSISVDLSLDQQCRSSHSV